MSVVVITGAAGLVGSMLRPRLARPGRTLRLLDLAPLTAGDRTLDGQRCASRDRQVVPGGMRQRLPGEGGERRADRRGHQRGQHRGGYDHPVRGHTARRQWSTWSHHKSQDSVLAET